MRHLLGSNTRTSSIFVDLYSPEGVDPDINIQDIMLVAVHWNSHEGDGRYNSLCDIDNDLDIDIADIMKVAAKWHTYTQPPE